MIGAETQLSLTRRHVREGAIRLVKQQALIARLQRSGFPTGTARELLVTFESVQRLHEDHLVRLLVEDACRAED